MKREICGAAICRGIIKAGGADAGYSIESLTEAGITAWGIKDILGRTYEAGDAVYFFLFEDGDGRILGKM